MFREVVRMLREVKAWWYARKMRKGGDYLVDLLEENGLARPVDVPSLKEQNRQMEEVVRAGARSRGS